jgi:hypothetical protein
MLTPSMQRSSQASHWHSRQDLENTKALGRDYPDDLIMCSSMLSQLCYFQAASYATARMSRLDRENQAQTLNFRAFADSA